MISIVLFAGAISWGQALVKPEKTEPGAIALAGGTERVMLHSQRSAGGAITVVQGARTGGGPENSVRVIVSGEGIISRAYSVERVLPTPLVVFGSHLVFLRNGLAGREVWTLNIDTGKELQLNLGMTPILAAGSEDTLVVVGPGGFGRMVLSTLGPSLKPETSELPMFTQAQLLRSFLAFGTSDRVLLVDQVEASYYPIKVGTAIEVGARVLLAGSEVDLSRRVAKPMGQFKEHLLLAHLKARNGNDLFFLGPYKTTEGYRLVEFDAEGRQQNAYRLQPEAPTAAGLNTSWAPGTVGVTQETINVVSVDGTKRSYRRP